MSDEEDITLRTYWRRILNDRRSDEDHKAFARLFLYSNERFHKKLIPLAATLRIEHGGF